MEVRGHSIRNAPTPAWAVALCHLADGVLLGLLLPTLGALLLITQSSSAGFHFAAALIRILSSPGYAVLVVCALLTSGAILPRAALQAFRVQGRTPAQRLFGIGWGGDDGKAMIYRENRTAAANLFLSALLAVAVCTAGVGVLGSTALRAHPFLMRAETEVIAAFNPFAQGSENRNWTIASFFYLGGAWPNQYAGRPVMHAFPYEKGPPTRFPGKFIAHWGASLPRLTIEGPKTPDRGFGPTATELQGCLLLQPHLSKAWLDPVESRCLGHRTQTLSRHVEEIEAALSGTIDWKLAWFETQSQDEGTDAPPRGLHLTATGQDRESGQPRLLERFVFVTPDRTHQAIFLDRDPSDRLASETLKKTIGSSRVLRSIDSSRAMSSYRLSEVNLAGLLVAGEKFDLSTTARVAEIQTLLLSKISSEPGSIDAYFHLAGTGMLMLRSLGKDASGSPLGIEWSPTLKQLVHSTWRYAQDLNDANPRQRANPKFEQLQNIWLESRKY